MSQRGVLVTFEGGEGSGKSTQLSVLAKRLESAGLPVRVLREPGGTHVGETIRSMLLDPGNSGLDARAELLLYEAARAQLVAEVIEPALEAGETVLCDRFLDSTTAYQGYGRRIALEEIVALNAIATGGMMPDRTLVLDIDPEVGLRRAIGTQGADRLEGEDMAFHLRVRDGFLALASADPDRVRIVDASGSFERVSELLLAELADLEPFDTLGS